MDNENLIAQIQNMVDSRAMYNDDDLVDFSYLFSLGEMRTILAALRATRPEEGLRWRPINSETPFKNEKLIVLTEQGNICKADQYCGHWNMPQAYQDDLPVAWIPCPSLPQEGCAK